MVKLSVRFAWFAIIAVILISTLALVVGRLIDTYAITAQFAGPASSLAQRNGDIMLIDLNRSLRADYKMPFKYVNSVDIWGIRHNLFITTRHNSVPNQRYERGFYVHNILTGETHTLSHSVSDSFPVPDVVSYSNMYLRDQDKMVFYEPHTQTIYLYDFNTGERTEVWTFDEGPADPYLSISPSSDGQKLAVTGRFRENLIYIFNLDGTPPTTLPSNGRISYLSWMQNDQYLFLQNFESGNNTPIDLISVEDGTEHPYTVDMEGTNVSWWGCEERWLRYVVINNRFREGYVLDMTTGEKVRVNDHPLLVNQNIEMIWPNEDCESFIIYGFAGSSRNMSPTMQPIYYADTMFEEIRLIDDAATGTWYGEPEDNTFYYRKDDTTTQKTTIYKRMLKPWGEPIKIAEYDLIEGWTQWAQDRSFITYTERSGRGNYYTPYSGRLIIYDPETGEKRYLTREDERLDYYLLYRWQENR
jgi:hypothetical protein